jgi:membrane-bound lytic murein transglycosylase D
LALLAARHGVSAANLATWNNLNPNVKLTAGKKLAVLVPSKETRRLSKPVPAAGKGQQPNSTKALPAAKAAAKPAPKSTQRAVQR